MMNFFSNKPEFYKRVKRGGQSVLFTVEPHGDGKSSYVFGSIVIENIGLAKVSFVEIGWPFVKGMPPVDYASRADTVISAAKALVDFRATKDVEDTAELLAKLTAAPKECIINELVMVNALSASIVVLPQTGYDLDGMRRSIESRRVNKANALIDTALGQKVPGQETSAQPPPAEEPKTDIKKTFH